MRKIDEACLLDSCWSKAKDDEMLFILLARDLAAPATIRFWIQERIRLGKNRPEDAKLLEAEACAKAMEAALLQADVAALDAITTQDAARNAIDGEVYRRVNRRRAEVILGPCPHDDPEFLDLQRCVFRVVDLAHPYPPITPKLEEIRKRLAGEAKCQGPAPTHDPDASTHSEP